MLDLPHLLAQTCVGQLDPRSLSVVRLETTRQLFLVFGETSSHPAFVVQFGEEEPLTRLHRVLTLLYPHAPDMIPESLFCGPANAGGFMHVQSGLRGLPWFRIRDRFHDPAEWRRLRGRAIAALGRLHSAIGLVPEWRSTVNPADHLRRSIDQLRTHERNLPAPVESVLTSAVANLEPLAPVQWQWQHGDFCMNNVIVDDAGIGVIDFEEFGKTAVPLHDEFGLALSLYQLGRDARPSALQELVDACLAPTVARYPALSAHVEALFLEHLVHGINECDLRPNRLVQRRWLWEMLQRYVACPSIVFPSRQPTAAA